MLDRCMHYAVLLALSLIDAPPCVLAHSTPQLGDCNLTLVSLLPASCAAGGGESFLPADLLALAGATPESLYVEAERRTHLGVSMGESNTSDLGGNQPGGVANNQASTIKGSEIGGTSKPGVPKWLKL